MSYFNITNNTFTTNRIVKYEDNYKNRVLVKSKDDGDSLVIKCRPANINTIIDPIELSFPYDLDGINFNIKTDTLTQSELNDEIANLQEFLQNVINLATKWIEISYELKAYFSNTSAVASLTLGYFQKQCPQITAFDIEQSLLGDIVDRLSNYEEMSEFVQMAAIEK